MFALHDAFNQNKAEVDDLKTRYRAGTVGDVEVKEKCIVAVNQFLDPIRVRRRHYEQEKGLVEEIIYRGTERTNQVANETINLMRKAMGLSGLWNKISRTARDRMEKSDGQKDSKPNKKVTSKPSKKLPPKVSKALAKSKVVRKPSAKPAPKPVPSR